MKPDLPNIGGQAVIEGVMMRGPKSYAISARNPKGQIVSRITPHTAWSKRNWFLGLPFIRGTVILMESLVLGIRALEYSANVSLEEEEQSISKGEFIFSFFISMLFAVALFIALPAYLFSRLKGLAIPLVSLNLIEGLVRISIFLIFITIISLMKDMRRVFEYHGAEHKAIYLYDEVRDKSKLNIKDAQTHSTLHASCGTSFLLIVLVVSILVFSFLGRPGFIQRIGLKLLLLPLIAGISYEFIRLARKKDAPLWARILVTPGKWLQLLTTREPSDDQVEVAIEALKNVVE